MQPYRAWMRQIITGVLIENEIFNQAAATKMSPL